MEEKIKWHKYDMYYRDGHFKKWIMGEYQNKLMSIFVNFKSNRLEAVLMAIILNHDEEIEYLYKRDYIGMGEDFLKKMINKIKSKKLEMEKIVKREDQDLTFYEIDLHLS